MTKRKNTMTANLPIWFDGQKINEALFCEDFLRECKLIFANRAFFTPEGRVTDVMLLRGEIYERLKDCATNNIPRKISNIMEVLKLEAQVSDFPPEQDKIHLFNGTLLLDGTFIEGKEQIVQSRLPIFYNPNASIPKRWLVFLEGLLYEEDIPTLQEFIGYCLIPSNKGQRMMVIKGDGGEGKTQIGAGLGSIFGTNMKDGSIGKISENRFARADLEHVLLCVVDDPDLAENMKLEAEGIFLWAFEGLQRLVSNNFKFTESERIRENREAVKRDNNNLFDFMDSEGYIRFREDATVSSKELYTTYQMWCEENSMIPLKARSFSDAVVKNAEKCNIKHCNTVINSAGRRVWGFLGMESLLRPDHTGFYPVSQCTYVPEEWRE